MKSIKEETVIVPDAGDGEEEAMKTQQTKSSRACSPSCPQTWKPERGQRWELLIIEQGHVFGWCFDVNMPAMQHACCLGCGRAYHLGVFPPPVKRSKKANAKSQTRPPLVCGLTSRIRQRVGFRKHQATQ